MVSKPWTQLSGNTGQLTEEELADCGLLSELFPQTTAQRVAKLRSAREALGLKRLELYAHPDDWPAIKSLAEKLQRKRARVEKQRAG